MSVILSHNKFGTKTPPGQSYALLRNRSKKKLKILNHRQKAALALGWEFFYPHPKSIPRIGQKKSRKWDIPGRGIEDPRKISNTKSSILGIEIGNFGCGKILKKSGNRDWGFPRPKNLEFREWGSGIFETNFEIVGIFIPGIENFIEFKDLSFLNRGISIPGNFSGSHLWTEN